MLVVPITEFTESNMLVFIPQIEHTRNLQAPKVKGVDCQTASLYAVFAQADQVDVKSLSPNSLAE